MIRKSLGIDLLNDDEVASMLASNPKIIVEEVPDPEDPTMTVRHYGYRAKFGRVGDRAGLVGQINRSRYGVRWGDLMDAYDGVERVRFFFLLFSWRFFFLLLPARGGIDFP